MAVLLFTVGAVVIGASDLLAGAEPAVEGGTAPPTYYVAMGDSLAAGFGADPTSNSYVNQIYQHEATRIPGLQLQNFGCPGATTESLLNGPSCSASTQIEQVEAFLQWHPGAVAFLTIDIGGNDVARCVHGAAFDTACLSSAFSAVQTNVPKIVARLTAAYPGLRGFGMNYYDPFLVTWLSGSSGQTFARQTVDRADTFSSILNGAYDAGGFGAVDVASRFDTDNFSPTGSYKGKPEPQNVANICNWTHMCESSDFHANNTGHALLAKSFEELIDMSPPPVVPTTIPPASPPETVPAPASGHKLPHTL